MQRHGQAGTSGVRTVVGRHRSAGRCPTTTPARRGHSNSQVAFTGPTLARTKLHVALVRREPSAGSLDVWSRLGIRSCQLSATRASGVGLRGRSVLPRRQPGLHLRRRGARSMSHVSRPSPACSNSSPGPTLRQMRGSGHQRPTVDPTDVLEALRPVSRHALHVLRASRRAKPPVARVASRVDVTPRWSPTRNWHFD